MEIARKWIEKASLEKPEIIDSWVAVTISNLKIEDNKKQQKYCKKSKLLILPEKIDCIERYKNQMMDGNYLLIRSS